MTSVRTMRLAAGFALLAAALFGGGGAPDVRPMWAVREAPRGAPRIGLLDRQAVVTAYYASVFWEDWLASNLGARDRAAALGEHERAQDIEAEGLAAQQRAHEQLAGRAPLDNIARHLAGELGRLATAQRVHAIWVADEFPGSSGTTVDLTAAFVALLPPAAPLRP